MRPWEEGSFFHVKNIIAVFIIKGHNCNNVPQAIQKRRLLQFKEKNKYLVPEGNTCIINSFKKVWFLLLLILSSSLKGILEAASGQGLDELNCTIF